MKFSITIPTYKSRYLNEAIKSVLCQTYTDWELIIVDDCSPEKLEELVKPYLCDSRVFFFRNEKNFGAEHVVDNWNRCLSHCTGDYVICIGDDDCLPSTALEGYHELITKHPDLYVYHGRSVIIDEDSNVIGVQEERPEWESALSLMWNRWDNRDMQFIGDFCFDVNHLKEQGGYFQIPLAWGSDDVSAVRAALAKGIANTQHICFNYRRNRYSITSSGNAFKKMEATCACYIWFSNTLKSLKDIVTCEMDKKYLATATDVMSLYYYRSIGQNCVDAMRGNPFRIITCKRKLKVFGYTNYTYIRFYITSLLNIFR